MSKSKSQEKTSALLKTDLGIGVGTLFENFQTSGFLKF